MYHLLQCNSVGSKKNNDHHNPFSGFTLFFKFFTFVPRLFSYFLFHDSGSTSTVLNCESGQPAAKQNLHLLLKKNIRIEYGIVIMKKKGIRNREIAF